MDIFIVKKFLYKPPPNFQKKHVLVALVNKTNIKTGYYRKITQQNRSKIGAKTLAILMTVFRSSELQNLDPVQTVLDMAKSCLNIHLSANYAVKNAF